jgi:hypothetical protein
MPKYLPTLVRWSRPASVALVVAAVAIAACSETTSPPSQSKTEVAIASARSIAVTLPQSYIAQGLLRSTPLSQDVSVTRAIPNAGGVIAVPGTGMQLVIPRGAFPESQLTFTVTARAGSTIAYDFEPHGRVFLQPLTITQNLAATNLRGTKLPPGFIADIQGAYFPSDALVDPNTGISVVTELRPATTETTISGSQLSFPIWHFSGYLVSVGREDSF